jgi:hypothetical protein
VLPVRNRWRPNTGHDSGAHLSLSLAYSTRMARRLRGGAVRISASLSTGSASLQHYHTDRCAGALLQPRVSKSGLERKNLEERQVHTFETSRQNFHIYFHGDSGKPKLPGLHQLFRQPYIDALSRTRITRFLSDFLLSILISALFQCHVNNRLCVQVELIPLNFCRTSTEQFCLSYPVLAL